MNDETLDEVLKKYGPFKLINHKQERDLMRQGKFRFILTVIGLDDGVCVGDSGHHLVNVLYVYESTKEMPYPLHIPGIWFGDNGLPKEGDSA